MDRKAEFGEKLRALRTERRMSQAELAKAVGFSDRSSINHLETGRNSCTRETVARLCKVLNTSPLYFYEDDTPDLSEFMEYLPYLKNADENIRKVVRKLLDMPERQ